MYVVIVFFEAEPEHAVEFQRALLEQARNSLEAESACSVFEVAVDCKNSHEFFLYEVYDTEEDFQAHLKTPHFLSFDKFAAPLTRKKTVHTYNLLSGSGK